MLSVNGQTVNILGFVATMSLSELFNSAVVAQKQPWTIHTALAWMCCSKTIFKTCGGLDLARGRPLI